ncbi:hypothetical protein ES707_11410 [subsurface metagenome]
MGIKVIMEFPDEATVRVIVYVYNDENVLTQPTAVKITIFEPSYDPEGEDPPIVNGEDIVVSGRVEDGIYEYYYHKGETSEPMEAGQWRGEVAVIDGGGTGAIISPGKFSFKVR